MSDRQIEAMAKAIQDEANDYSQAMEFRALRFARAALAASDAKYVPMLVEALQRAGRPAQREFSGNDTHRLDECCAIANKALAQLPPEIMDCK